MFSPFGFNSNLDYNAQTFIQRTGITDATVKSAINQLCIDLKNEGLYQLLDAAYPLAGTTATTQKFNLINPLDSNGAYRLTFSGGITHDTNGLRGNGTNAYAITNYVPSSVAGWSLDQGSVSVYITATDITSGTGVAIGGRNSSAPLSRTSIQPRTASDLSVFTVDSETNTVSGTNATDIRGFFGVTRTSSTNVEFVIRSGSATSASSTDENELNRGIYLLAQNTNGSPGNYLDVTIGWAHIASKLMTGAQLETLRDVVTTYQTTLSRNV